MTEAKEKPAPAPLVFISHDLRDAELATSFSELLHNVSSGTLKSFNSSDKTGTRGILYGDDWYSTVIEKARSASDVVCLLTERSLGRPWILYEIGIAKGNSDVRIIGIALGIPPGKANDGPFSQFQNCSDDVESLTGLIVQLTERIPSIQPNRDFIETQVDIFKSEASSIIKKLAGVGRPEKEDESQNVAFRSNKGSVSSGPSTIAVAVLGFYNKQKATTLPKGLIIQALKKEFGRIQVESAIDELMTAKMLYPSRMASVSRDLLYSLLQEGTDYITKKMNQVAFPSKTLHVDEIMRKPDERRTSFGKS